MYRNWDRSTQTILGSGKLLNQLAFRIYRVVSGRFFYHSFPLGKEDVQKTDKMTVNKFMLKIRNGFSPITH
jgi:hypothetical protein